MTLEQAQIYGAGVANKSGSSVLVYRTTKGDHGVAFTLPGSTNVRVGERIYPTNMMQVINKLDRVMQYLQNSIAVGRKDVIAACEAVEVVRSARIQIQVEGW